MSLDHFQIRSIRSSTNSPPDSINILPNSTSSQQVCATNIGTPWLHTKLTAQQRSEAIHNAFQRRHRREPRSIRDQCALAPACGRESEQRQSPAALEGACEEHPPDQPAHQGCRAYHPHPREQRPT